VAVLKEKPKVGGSHYYTLTGKACHTQVGKNGLERNTTLRDARKLKLIPSVTGITGIFAKPGLERWKLNEICRIAFELEPIDGESLADFTDRCLVAHQKPKETAADFGIEVHDSLDKYFEGKPIPDHLLEYVQPAFDWKQKNQLEFIEREKILINSQHGFGGMVDIVGKGPDGQQFIIDWKTRKTKPKVKVTSYDFQVHQIAAYGGTYFGEEEILEGRVYGANCIISSTEPGRFEVISYAPEELAEAWKSFVAACEIWRSLKKYDPRPGR
jgi:hypothetical protein